MKNPREILAVDCETDPFKHGRVPEPFVWGAYNGREYWQFETTEELALFLSGRDCIAYAHNGGKFDWHYVLDYLNTCEPITVINGRIARAKLGACELRDSLNLIPVPLKKLQSSKGEKLDIEYWKLEKEHRQEHRAEIERYLEQDCVVLWENVSRFIDEYGLHLTQASAAMKIWEDMSGETEKTDPVYFDQYSRFYYGGRTECFEKGLITDPFKVYDIKSAYPHAMAVAKHPKGAPHLADWDGKDGAALVTVIARARGVFPYREENGSLSFPADNKRRTFNVTGWELKLYEEKFGPVEQVLECFRFSFLYDFSPYVSRFYKLKAEAEAKGDVSGRHFAKIFLNALYGKFASNPENYSEFQLIDLNEHATPPGYVLCDLHAEGRAFVSKPLDENKMRFFNVATAASITGYVRAKLARVILESKRPLYCDTDSIACVEFAGDRIGPNLGNWELEANCVRGAIGGKKLYAFKTTSGNYKTASKGAKLSEKDIFALAEGAEIFYKPNAPTFSAKKKDARFVNRTLKRT